MISRDSESPQIIPGGYSSPRMARSTSPAFNPLLYGFSARKVGEDRVYVSKGWLFVDGNAQYECSPPAGFRDVASGNTESLWVVLTTDVDGAPTGAPAVSWETSPPTGLQKHRQAQTDSESDTGQTGKYAWEVLEIANAAGIITVTPKCHAIFYYSDRSKRNWPDMPGLPPPDTANRYYGLCIDTGGAPSWVETVTPVQSTSTTPSTTHFPVGAQGLHKNTASGAVTLVYNDGGTLRTVGLT